MVLLYSHGITWKLLLLFWSQSSRAGFLNVTFCQKNPIHGQDYSSWEHPFQQLFSYHEQTMIEGNDLHFEGGWKQRLGLLPVEQEAAGLKCSGQNSDETVRARTGFIQYSWVQMFSGYSCTTCVWSCFLLYWGHQEWGVFPVPGSNPLSSQLFNAGQLSCCSLSSWQLGQQRYNISEPLSMSAWRLLSNTAKLRASRGVSDK